MYEHLNSYNSPYKFNGKELDEEIEERDSPNLKTIMMWRQTGNYYYGARYYDPKWSIWLSVDPLAEKYPTISSYAYVANNPVIYIDPNGEDIYLTFVGKEKNKAKQMYKQVVSKALGGLYEVKISSAGKATLVRTEKEGKLTTGQQAFYDAYKEISESEFDVNHTVKKDQWQPFVGSFEESTLDIGDVAVFDESGEGADSSAGALIHETVEQWEKAKMGLKPGDKGTKEQNKKAHDEGRRVQGLVQGNEIIDDQGKVLIFLESDGTKTRQEWNVQENNVPLKPIQVYKTKID